MTTSKNLPVIQANFIKQFDGTLTSVLSFEQLHLILNPTFTAHYFFVSGSCDEDTITTKNTDGSFEYYGNQTDEQITNAYKLAEEVRDFILKHNPQPLESIVNYDHDAMRQFAKKISMVRRRAAFKIDGQIVLVPGLKM